MSECINRSMLTNEEVKNLYKTSEKKQLRVMIPLEVFKEIMDNIPNEWAYDPAARAMEVTRRLIIAKELEDKSSD